MRSLRDSKEVTEVTPFLHVIPVRPEDWDATFLKGGTTESWQDVRGVTRRSSLGRAAFVRRSQSSLSHLAPATSSSRL